MPLRCSRPTSMAMFDSPTTVQQHLLVRMVEPSDRCGYLCQRWPGRGGKAPSCVYEISGQGREPPVSFNASTAYACFRSPMLLPNIVHALDAELSRLHRLRAIVASLETPVQPQPLRTVPENAPAPTPEPTLTRLPPKREPHRRGPRARPAPEIARALSANIPAGPVVIPPAAKKPEPPPAPASVAVPPGSFAALVRAAERESAS